MHHCATFRQYQQNCFGDRDFFIIKITIICHLGFSKFLSPIGFGGVLICLVIQNYVKTGQTAEAILHVAFFKTMAVRHLEFLII